MLDDFKGFGKGNGRMGGTTSKEWRKEPKPPNLGTSSPGFPDGFDADFRAWRRCHPAAAGERPGEVRRACRQVITAAARTPKTPTIIPGARREEEIVQKLC